MDRNEEFMKVALEKARECAEYDEVPVGAVVVKNGEIIAACGNGRETKRMQQPTLKPQQSEKPARNLADGT